MHAYITQSLQVPFGHSAVSRIVDLSNFAQLFIYGQKLIQKLSRFQNNHLENTLFNLTCNRCTTTFWDEIRTHYKRDTNALFQTKIEHATSWTMRACLHFFMVHHKTYVVWISILPLSVPVGMCLPWRSIRKWKSTQFFSTLLSIYRSFASLRTGK